MNSREHEEVFMMYSVASFGPRYIAQSWGSNIALQYSSKSGMVTLPHVLLLFRIVLATLDFFVFPYELFFQDL